MFDKNKIGFRNTIQENFTIYLNYFQGRSQPSCKGGEGAQLVGNQSLKVIQLYSCSEGIRVSLEEAFLNVQLVRSALL